MLNGNVGVDDSRPWTVTSHAGGLDGEEDNNPFSPLEIGRAKKGTYSLSVAGYAGNATTCWSGRRKATRRFMEQAGKEAFSPYFKEAKFKLKREKILSIINERSFFRKKKIFLFDRVIFIRRITASFFMRESRYPCFPRLPYNSFSESLFFQGRRI